MHILTHLRLAPALAIVMLTSPHARADDTVLLSSLDLSKARQGFGHPGVDKSVDGHPITLAGQVFAHGFGSHSPGTLFVDLTGAGATRFTATVGIDDEVRPHRGSAEFEVAGEDRKILWRSGILHQGDAPKRVDVDLTGRKRVYLRITDGGDGFDFDHADWAQAQFTVSGAHPTAIDIPATQPEISLAAPAPRAAIVKPFVAGGPLRKPPMGWNSYDCFGDDVTEAEVLANARYVADNMRSSGWDTIVVDYRWYDPGASKAPNDTKSRDGAALTMDATGRLLPSPNRFPSAAATAGFKGLADQIHAMGMKFGIHIMRGIPRLAVKSNLPIDGSTFHAADAANTADTCPWCPDMYGVRGETPAGRAYYDSLLHLYASWGVDYIKMDDTSSPYHADEIEAVHSAIQKCGRPIVYSLSPGETPISEAAHVAAHANVWRISGDFWDSWRPLDHAFELAARWQGVAGPGHWPDADMLPVGHISVSNRSVGRDRRTNFTHAEQVTLMSLWCLMPSPLMVGANLPDNDPWTLALLTNPEVLALNQDGAGNSANRVSQQGTREVWAKTLADGSRAVGLFNRDDLDDLVTVRWKDLGINGRQSVRDLWQRKDLDAADRQFTATVPAHGCVLIRVEKAAK